MAAPVLLGWQLHIITVLLDEEALPILKSLEAAALELEGRVVLEKLAVKDLPGAVSGH